MKVLLTGGGTGGHVYPAVALANKIKEENPEAEVLFVGTATGIESKIVPKAGYDIKTITVQGFRRKIDFENVKRIFKLCKGMLQAFRIVKTFKPDIVIGTGGYVSGPVLYCSANKNTVTFIHEQNSYPGVTNKILAKRVSKVGVSFEDAISRFNNVDKRKIHIVGTPVRKELLGVSKEEARKVVGVPEDKKMVLCYGGSGGFDAINSSMIEIIDRLIDEDVAFVFATGNSHYDEVKLKINNENLKPYQRVVAYLDDMKNYLAASDLVIGSAGATSIAEITAIGRASIIIPKAYTADNHQEYNAKSMTQSGASIYISEEDITGEKLYNSIKSILDDDQRQRDMERNSYNLGKRESVDEIYNIIMDEYKKIKEGC